MPKVCAITGKGTKHQTSSTRKGSPKRRGGVGLKQVGVHKRAIRANLQKRTIWVEGKPQRVWLSTKALREIDPTMLVNPQSLSKR
jgi:large subunit ribosomal protein L28